jgi:hypothetical protein
MAVTSATPTASGVVATGFGTPPIMTQELADAASSYTRTLVAQRELLLQLQLSLHNRMMPEQYFAAPEAKSPTVRRLPARGRYTASR